MMKENWSEPNHPDVKLDVMSDDLPEFALPFAETTGKPDNKKEQAYCDYAVMCVRAGRSLVEPHELMKMHHSNCCVLRLTVEQVDVLQVIILILDKIEDDAYELHRRARRGFQI